ncbi:hypothetical protein V1512DRAFT_257979 [Lipomyces arxii]|uniref:uncharacterized protein n=1 Tax=Lipomyces arxii TaxID=56418 RepID=UPI0034CDF960
MLRTPTTKVTLVLVTIVVAVLTSVLSFFRVYKGNIVVTDKSLPPLTQQQLLGKACHNETFGFGEIVYISMPFRTDRQDAMNLLAAYSDVKLNLIPGVDGKTMSRKEIPDHTPKDVRQTELGCWRAHVNAWRYMLDSHHETMLIVEDDIDWDYNIKDILELLSTEIRKNTELRLKPMTNREQQTAPYGLDWDMLVLGQCNDEANPARRDLYHSYEDPNSPSFSQIFERFIPHMSSLIDPTKIGVQRVISPSYGPICTMGYAITRKGAMRLIAELSYIGLDGAVDEALQHRFMDGGLRGLTVTPPLFNGWRVNGAKDTDNQNWRYYNTVQGLGNAGAFSRNIKNSTRTQMIADLSQNVWEEYDKIKPIDPSFKARKPIYATTTFVPPAEATSKQGGKHQ